MTSALNIVSPLLNRNAKTHAVFIFFIEINDSSFFFVAGEDEHLPAVEVLY